MLAMNRVTQKSDSFLCGLFFILCFRHSIYNGICLPMKGSEKINLLSQIFMTPREGRRSHLKIIYYG